MANLKELPPEERIKKLKELEKKKKQEIAEAQKLLKDSHKEISDREDWKRRVPIPQIASEEMDALSEAEKEIFKSHRDVAEAQKATKEIPKPSKEELALEEAVQREQVELPPELMQSDYTLKLSQEPMQELYQEMKDIYQRTEEKGYVSADEQRKIGYLSAAAERKLEDGDVGSYSLTETVAEAAMLTKQIGKRMMYKGTTENNYQT